jgi:deoxyhypusine synthase
MARMEPLRFSREPNTRGGIEELADNYSASSYQGRNLGIAMKLCGRSLHNGSVIGLTVAGAMTPAGHGGYYAQLMAHGAIDFIVATGANLTHDMHFVQGARVEQCEPLNSPTDKPDHELIYDTMLYPEALSMVDEAVRDFVSAFDHKCEMSSSQFYHEFGGYLLQRYQKDRDAPLEDISMLVAAHKYDVPIYTPDFMNSEIGMALLMAHIDGVSKLNVSALVDIEQITGLMYTCSRSSPIFLIIIGGGGPKNFATQTGPLIIEDRTPTLGKLFRCSPRRICRMEEDRSRSDR